MFYNHLVKDVYSGIGSLREFDKLVEEQPALIMGPDEDIDRNMYREHGAKMPERMTDMGWPRSRPDFWRVRH